MSAKFNNCGYQRKGTIGFKANCKTENAYELYEGNGT